jgi:hypothetical protein
VLSYAVLLLRISWRAVFVLSVAVAAVIVCPSRIRYNNR